MFLWSAHENFQKHFTGRSKKIEILGPAHNGGCPCCFVAMKKWCAVAQKKKGVLDNNRRGACDFTLQIQKPQIIILLSGSPCSHHFLLVHTWSRSLWIYSLELSWFFFTTLQSNSLQPKLSLSNHTSHHKHSQMKSWLQQYGPSISHIPKALTSERQFPWRPKFAKFLLSTHKWGFRSPNASH
jgi:hypothetical protein